MDRLRSSRWQIVLGIGLSCALLGTVGAQELPTAAVAVAKEESVIVRVRTEAEAAQVAQRRRVKVFDFDERKLGNLEMVPMHWFRRHEQGYPLYTEGRFDKEQGDPSPSFWLGASGGNVAFDYRGRDVPVKANSDYRITARIRPKDLRHARAILGVHFLNRAGIRIKGSEVRSELVGGLMAGDDWETVTVELPGAFPDARYIGLTATVEQWRRWSADEKRPGQIEFRDVQGGAWFDSIEVIRLPRILLTTTTPGNVFGPGQTAVLLAEAGDSDGVGLEAKLDVRSASGEQVHTEKLAIRKKRQVQAHRVELPDLKPGLYHATLTMMSNERTLVERKMNFAKLAPPVRPGFRRAHGFGIILNTDQQGRWDETIHLLDQARVNHVKLPIWWAGLTKKQITTADDGLDPLIQSLVRERVVLTGVLSDPPEPLLGPDRGRRRSLIDLLSEDAAAWSPFVKMTLSRYATMIPRWQLGADGQEDLLWDDRLAQALENLRASVASLVYGPQLVVPWSASHVNQGPPLPAEYISLTIPESIPPESIRGQLATFQSDRHKEIWAVVEPLPEKAYPRLPRLADFAKRVLYVHEAGVDQIFMRQPWSKMPLAIDHELQPVENYIIFRTLADMLNRTLAVGEIDLGRKAHGLIFDHVGRSVLAVWDDAGSSAPVSHQISLGEGMEQVDLWGTRRPLETVGENVSVQLGPVPVFLIGAPTWLSRTIGSFNLKPGKVEALIKTHPILFSFTNHRSEPVSGEVHLVPPAGWEVEPDLLRFSLNGGETFQHELGVRFPYSQTAGAHQVMANVKLFADRRRDLKIPMPIEVQLTGIRIQTLVEVRGDRVIVQQTISNLSDKVVTFHGTCMVPDVPAVGIQRLIVPELAPGRSTTRVYRLSGAATLAGKRVRVTLRDRGQGRVYNEELIIP